MTRLHSFFASAIVVDLNLRIPVIEQHLDHQTMSVIREPQQAILFDVELRKGPNSLYVKTGFLYLIAHSTSRPCSPIPRASAIVLIGQI